MGIVWYTEHQPARPHHAAGYGPANTRHAMTQTSRDEPTVGSAIQYPTCAPSITIIARHLDSEFPVLVFPPTNVHNSHFVKTGINRLVSTPVNRTEMFLFGETSGTLPLSLGTSLTSAQLESALPSCT